MANEWCTYKNQPRTETMCHSGTALISGVVVTAECVGDVGYGVWARPPYKTRRKTYEKVVTPSRRRYATVKYTKASQCGSHG
jgi:hypothetical protein